MENVKLTLLLIITIIFAFNINAYARNPETVVSKEKTFKAGEQLEFSFKSNEISRLRLIVKNQCNSESEFWYTSFKDGKELSHTKIGPQSIRTHKLEKKITDKKTVRWLDEKDVTLVTDNMDKLVIHVTKGEVSITLYK